MKQVRLVYFAWVRDRIGKPEEMRDIPDEVETVADLMRWLKAQGEEYEYAFENETIIRAAIDKVHASGQTPVASAREIAFFPPMTGG